MVKDEEIIRLARGLYALPEGGKVGKKERSNGQVTEDAVEMDDLSDLSNLSSGNGFNQPALGPPGDSLDEFM